MTPKGEIYVIEVNPLPGLTPGYSDLCLIAKAAGIEYRTLIGEILAGGLKRLREKRREAKAEQVKVPEARAAGGNGTLPAVPPVVSPAPPPAEGGTPGPTVLATSLPPNTPSE